MPLFSTRSPPPKKASSSTASYDGIPSSFSTGPCYTVSLTCLSADSSSIHTLSPSDGIITTYFLPLTDISPSKRQHKSVIFEPTPENESRIHRVVSKLPAYIIQSFKLDPPLELICVDNFLVDGMKKTNRKGRLPLLCAYNCRAAFVLDISYSCSRTTTDLEFHCEAQGCIDEVIEPFETHLLSSKLATSPKIIRIRPAPQSGFLGGGFYETLNPRAAMVMLTDEHSQHSLVVHHGISTSNNPSHSTPRLSGGYVSVPFSMRMEDVEDGDPLVDFSFLSSSPQGINSVLNAMTVVLTTRSGCLFLASPILFDGSVLPSKNIRACIKHLEQELARGQVDNQLLNSIDGAIWRRNRAALQFLLDAFGSLPPTQQTSQNSYYVTAKIFEGGARCGTAWPVSIQGPLCSSEIYNEQNQEDDIPCRVSCMEVTASSFTVGSIANAVLSGHRHLECDSSSSGHFVNFVIFPSATYPRFAFESKLDADMLNHLMHNSTVVADKIFIDTEDENNINSESIEKDFVIVTNNFFENGRDIAIVLDPVNKNMFHHVSRYGVYTINSDAFEVTGRKILSIMNDKKLEPLHHKNIKVNAYPSIEVTLNENGECANGNLSGAVVIGDTQYGHLLVTTHAKGDSNISVLNLSAAQYLHQNQIETFSEVATNDDALTTIQSISPLHEIIAPLFERITMAVSQMSKVVGGSTLTKNISAGGVALFLERKENSGKNIVAPLIEMNGIIQARMKFLQDIHANQEQQLSSLTEKIDALKCHAQSQQDAVKAVQMISEMLINRSAKVLSLMRNKAPIITHSEREYFDQIKRYDVQSSKWISLLEKMDALSKTLLERIDSSTYQLNLSSEQRTACVDLLNGQKVLLERNTSSLLLLQQSVRGLITESGIL